MNARRHAIRVGISRGWTEFKLSLKSPQDQGFYLFFAAATVGYLYLRRNTPVEGTDLLVPAVAMPSILGAIVAFSVYVGPAYQLAMEREDGTLLRAKAVPYGVVGHVTGVVLAQFLGLVPMLTVILLPSFLLFDNLMHRGLGGWLTVLWVLVLGIVAILPIGMIVGSLVPGIQKMGTWGMLPIMVLAGISGIFYPVQQLWTWLQGVAQVFPMYWMGLGMRSAFLPDAAAAVEIGGAWRQPWIVAVLGLWAVMGLSLVPGVLRKMARRQSGSAVEAAREQAAQWIR